MNILLSEIQIRLFTHLLIHSKNCHQGNVLAVVGMIMKGFYNTTYPERKLLMGIFLAIIFKHFFE